MKLEDQVCSLEPAKKLKELGAAGESLYVWVNNPNRDRGTNVDNWYLLKRADSYNFKEVRRPAPTVAELGVMLPMSISSFKSIPGEKRGAWQATDFDTEPEQAGDQFADTEADARAKMLIHLLEKGLVKP